MLTCTLVLHTYATVVAVGKTALAAHALALCIEEPSQYQRLSSDVDQQQC